MAATRRKLTLKDLILQSSGVENPVLEVKYEDPSRGYSFEVSAGSSDELAVFQHCDDILVLIKNRGYRYACLDLYQQGKQVWRFTIEGSKELRRHLGSKGLKLPDLEIAIRLYAHYRQNT